MKAPTQIPTALTQDEAAALQELARDKVVLEVGSWYGFSTVLMAQVAKQVWSVDWHLGDSRVGDVDTSHAFLDNLDQWRVRQKVVAIFGRAEEVLPLLGVGNFDTCFIDADHDAEAVLRDARLAKALDIHEVALHDYGRFFVKDAVDAFAAEVWAQPKVLANTLAVVRWQ